MNIIKIYIIKIPDSVVISSVYKYISFLNEEELDKFHCYRVDKKKIEFLIGRIVIKKLIAKELNLDIDSVKYYKNKYGKLFLCTSNINLDFFDFNLSHTNQLISFGMNRCGKIGVDVEDIRNNHLNLANKILTKTELDFIYTQNNKNAQNEAFYELWTRKEAYVKALGIGLTLSPPEIMVPFGKDILQKKGWSFITKKIFPHHLLSVAAESDHNIEIGFDIRELNFNDFLT